MLRFTIPLVKVSRHYSNIAKVALLTEKLSNRTLIRICGDSAPDFLQGLVTNDVKHLEKNACMFTMFLNAKGRVLFDSIIFSGGQNEYYLECDVTVQSALESHLQMFKVRRKITINNICEQYSLWTINFQSVVDDTVLGHKPKLQASDMKAKIDLLQTYTSYKTFLDPRVFLLGARVIVPTGTNLTDHLNNSNIHATETTFYRHLRYRLGVGEGAAELPCGNCLPLEANCDYLHGISFHKGCYIGQELTARTHHTGVVRKRIMPLVFDNNTSSPKFHDPVSVDTQERSVGKFLGQEQNSGIALLRIEEVLKAKQLSINSLNCSTYRPFWWPAEAPKERPL